MIMADQEFEFTTAQNQTIQVLSNRMKWVGGFQTVSGIVLGIAAITAFARGREGVALIFTAVLLVAIGLYTYIASRGFSKIVETVGADITHLMEAVTSLKSLYNIQFWLIIVYLIIIGIVLLTTLFGALFGHQMYG
jgi:hypothetical protein